MKMSAERSIRPVIWSALFGIWLLTGLLQPVHGQTFPVKIPHEFGETVIAEEPKRVVSISYIGHDFLLALGVFVGSLSSISVCILCYLFLSFKKR